MSASLHPTPADRQPRAMCDRCQRPTTVCYCAALTTLETQTRIVILQHPKERGMPIGTARMAHLCLPQSSLHVGIQWDESRAFRQACNDPERPPILLYPGPGAHDILNDPPASPVTLIVVDGTWTQARSMVRANPKLASLPRYAFHPPSPSNYRIRREPSMECVSTLEALMHVLGVLEGDPDRLRALMRPMNAMVDTQIAAMASNFNPRKERPRPRRTPYSRLPYEIRQRYDDLVLVMADANAWPARTPQARLGDDLVYWVACRPASGETLSFVLAPRNPMAPSTTTNVELREDALRAGGSVAEFLEAYAAFARPDDIMCSWGDHALRLLRSVGGECESFLDLRDGARLLNNRRTGSLKTYSAQWGIKPIGLDGRAGRCLRMICGILEGWRELSDSDQSRCP